MNQQFKQISSLERWAIENSLDLYGVRSWGGGYFDVSDAGEVIVTPKGDDPANAVYRPDTDEFSIIREFGYDDFKSRLS